MAESNAFSLPSSVDYRSQTLKHAGRRMVKTTFLQIYGAEFSSANEVTSDYKSDFK